MITLALPIKRVTTQSDCRGSIDRVHQNSDGNAFFLHAPSFFVTLEPMKTEVQKLRNTTSNTVVQLWSIKLCAVFWNTLYVVDLHIRFTILQAIYKKL